MSQTKEKSPRKAKKTSNNLDENNHNDLTCSSSQVETSKITQVFGSMNFYFKLRCKETKSRRKSLPPSEENQTKLNLLFSYFNPSITSHTNVPAVVFSQRQHCETQLLCFSYNYCIFFCSLPVVMFLKLQCAPACVLVPECECV